MAVAAADAPVLGVWLLPLLWGPPLLHFPVLLLLVLHTQQLQCSCLCHTAMLMKRLCCTFFFAILPRGKRKSEHIELAASARYEGEQHLLLIFLIQHTLQQIVKFLRLQLRLLHRAAAADAILRSLSFSHCCSRASVE